MKLINEQGQIRFCANGQVKLDTSLPKFQLLQKIKRPNEASGMTPDERNLYGSITFLDDAKPDEKLRKGMVKLSESNLRKYLNSPDAQAFNNKFSEYLNLEITNNNYSISISDSRIIMVDGEDRPKKVSFFVNYPQAKDLWACPRR